ncbi:cyclophane-forming radical SAM peptide maturase AmcB [Salinispora arenicola]|uniref:Radical SAM core domain-containing protein n=2 Tax=Salinispora arenicola TaxID=168697 RepID=A0A542XUI7_SALAC|nr:cyclophane-forming radical SAM peptide maturase AmcB [Salinispora arenicola]TQL39515.1 uncharacterized protein FB564_4775 [Salinispora arenicola]
MISDVARISYERYISSTFSNVLVQPTTYCTANCTYCYLPGRKNKNVMLGEVAEAVAASIAEQAAEHAVTILWHSGEPLATPIDQFMRLLQPFESLRQEGRVQHNVQSNGMLIDEAWCDIFIEYEFSIGISIDGPEQANANRINWAGRPIFPQLQRGITMLRERNIDFRAICTVSPQTVHDPSALLSFFDELGCREVGFNVEEIEGINVDRPHIDEAAVEEFWSGVVAHQIAGTGVQVREVQNITDYLTLARAGQKQKWLDARHEPGPAVSWDGRVVLMSPELLGVTAPHHEDFVVGNILRESIPSILARAHEVGYVSEFMQGLAGCESTCPFWSMCRGAHASNRYFETGTFATTETAHCRNTRQAPTVALAAALQ